MSGSSDGSWGIGRCDNCAVPTSPFLWGLGTTCEQHGRWLGVRGWAVQRGVHSSPPHARSHAIIMWQQWHRVLASPSPLFAVALCPWKGWKRKAAAAPPYLDHSPLCTPNRSHHHLYPPLPPSIPAPTPLHSLPVCSAIRDMVARGLRDPYSRFITPSEFSAMLKYDVSGVGLNLGTAEEFVNKTVGRAWVEGA